MTRRRLARVFWLGAAAILVAAALVSLVAIVRGSFSETDGRILGTLGALLYAGATALAGLALVERGRAALLGWSVLALSAGTFGMLATAIWTDDETVWRVATSGALYLVAGLVATTGLLLTARPALERLAVVAGVMTVIAVSLTLVPIWRDAGPGSTLAKGMSAAWILAALAYFLGPVLQRWSAIGEAETGERVLASLDGVDLLATRHPGADVAVQGRPRAGEHLVLRRRT